MKFTFTKIALLFAVLILIYSEMQERQHSGQIESSHLKETRLDLIPIFSAKTNIWIHKSPQWKSQVFGENNPLGVIALYSDTSYSITVMMREAGEWTIEDAVEAHRMSLTSNVSTNWCGEPLKLTEEATPTLRFAYTSYGSTTTAGVETPLPLLHVIDTRVIGNTIFRVQVTVFSDNSINTPITTDSPLYQKAVEALNRVFFTEIDSPDPPKIENSRPNLVEALLQRGALGHFALNVF